MPGRTLFFYLFGNSPFPPELNEAVECSRLRDYVEALGKEISYVKKMVLLEPGEISEKIYFLKNGCLRAFINQGEDTKQQTTHLWLDRSVISDSASFIQRKPSTYFIQVISPSATMCSLSHAQVAELIEEFPYTLPFLTHIANEDYGHSNKELLSKNTTTWKRLLELRERYPDFDRIVPKEYIASFLNIAPQHLSKIYRLNKEK